MHTDNQTNVQGPQSVEAEPSKGPFISLGTAVIMCVFTSLITLIIAAYGPSIAAKQGIKLPGAGSLTGNTIVYLDFEKVLEAGIKKSMQSNLSTEDVKVDADRFQEQINAALKTYTDAGYTIINNRALIKGAPDQDITGELIHKLAGVE